MSLDTIQNERTLMKKTAFLFLLALHWNSVFPSIVVIHTNHSSTEINTIVTKKTTEEIHCEEGEMIMVGGKNPLKKK